MRRGFTILEMAWVLAVMGAVVAITVPSFELVLRRAHADEAHTFLAAIHHAELRHFRDTGKYLECPATGEVPRGKADGQLSAPCWKTLLGDASGLRFRYSVELRDGSFVVRAEGDLDGDGQLSDYRLDGRTQALETKDGLE